MRKSVECFFICKKKSYICIIKEHNFKTKILYVGKKLNQDLRAEFSQ